MIFDLLAGLVFVGLVLATGVAFVGVLCGIRKRSGKATLVRLGFCLSPLVVYVLFCVWIFGPADYYRQSDLAAAYQTEFGNLPSEDVIDMRARQVVVGDSGAAWLKFRASSQTIDDLLGRFVASDQTTFAQAGVGGNVPSWWTPEADHVAAFYAADHWSKDFGRSTAYLGINREEKIVYFHHVGSD